MDKITLEDLLVEEANDVKLRESDAMLRSARSVLHEADVMRRYGIKVRATAYQLRVEAMGLDWCATDERRVV